MRMDRWGLGTYIGVDVDGLLAGVKVGQLTLPEAPGVVAQVAWVRHLVVDGDEGEVALHLVEEQPDGVLGGREVAVKQSVAAVLGFEAQGELGQLLDASRFLQHCQRKMNCGSHVRVFR